MKKLFLNVYKKARQFVRDSVELSFAPYLVINSKMGKEHFCWSWKAAQEWLTCYDARKFGPTIVYNWQREIVAMKSA